MSRKKWKKRLGIAAAAIVGVVIGAALVGWMLLRSTPGWYPTAVLTAEQKRVIAQDAENKLILVQNAAAQARADERIAHRNATTLPAANVITLTLSDDEINALLEKWTVWPIVKRGYERFMSDPKIVLEDGRLILAGHISEVDALASVHFAPSIDEQGRLHVELAGVQAGKLPLPQGLLSRYQQQAAGAVDRCMPLWRAQASIDTSGAANGAAISAVMGMLVMDVLTNQPSDSVLFVPLADGRNVAVKLIGLKIESHKLTLVVQPMTPSERSAALGRIRSGLQSN